MTLKGLNLKSNETYMSAYIHIFSDSDVVFHNQHLKRASEDLPRPCDFLPHSGNVWKLRLRYIFCYIFSDYSCQRNWYLCKIQKSWFSPLKIFAVERKLSGSFHFLNIILWETLRTSFYIIWGSNIIRNSPSIGI